MKGSGANAVPTQGLKWRMGWDSNPRNAFTFGGFQDRYLKPLGHPSGAGCLTYFLHRKKPVYY